MRDQRTQNRINKHLKVCKSANKSVLADAVDNENTAITMAGNSVYLFDNIWLFLLGIVLKNRLKCLKLFA